ncbi:RNA polymerase subunit sigma-70 [Burkholderia singularis]|uniref:RNA polymerase subunit sigma-70 n=1 Tax=Burkholderia singularis TaxID=1503053 RepID=A0A103E754_9BURK|nr:sigma-70 family RNA polymerase sigma factor [Burkholderia singularis]KVE29563.1 RNA polymerase subunit sigma-70 [Burkholderia singularis]
MTGADLASTLPRLLPRLLAFARRLCGDTHDADDLVQRACLRALERSHQLQRDTSPLNWMMSIVHSSWMSELRARRVRTRSQIDWNDDFMNALENPAAVDPQVQAMNAQVIRAVELLPETLRGTMMLIAIEGLSYQEAAGELDVPIGTVMSRLWRARRSIGAQFEMSDC